MSHAVRASVVIATHGRPEAIGRLVRQLCDQSLSKQTYEVVVVDDGSPEPVATRLVALSPSLRLTIARQRNAGPAAARDVGVRLARGEILVILDDDMQVGPRFLEAHLAHHERHGSAVVLGRMRPDPGLRHMPLFERFHAAQLDAMATAFRNGTQQPRGHHLYTGNVSLRRADYQAVGGFDTSLRRSEDRELGLRLEKRGIHFIFGEGDVESIHSSDHVDRRAWIERARLYGAYELRIARKHPEMADADPWRFIGVVSSAVRPFYVLSALAPRAGQAAGEAAMRVSEILDRFSLDRLALAGTTVAYGASYFGGVGAESGGAKGAAAGLCTWLSPAPLRRWARDVRADHDCLRHYRAKYAKEAIATDALPRHLVEKVGLQLLAAVRLMQALVSSGRVGAAKAVSRAIRHLYGSDIHWKAEIAPGIMVVHGMGLVISHAARIEAGCVLSQHVTLGQGIDPTSRRVGAPRLERDVHVGPGVTILGPVVVGAGSKIMAGAVLNRSVPPGSLVTPSQAAVSPRRRRPIPATNGVGVRTTFADRPSVATPDRPLGREEATSS